MTRLVAFIVILACLAPPAWGRMLPVPKRRIGTPPPVIIKKLMRANLAKAKPQKSQPLITWLADSDERLSAAAIFDQPAGRIYQVRTAGPLLLTDVVAVDYGVRELYTPVLLITANTGNRLVARLLAEKEPLDTETARRADLLRAAVPTAAGADERRIMEAIVDHQVALAVHRYQDRIRLGRLVVIGGVIDLENRYGLGAGRLVIINVNGETDPERLRRSPLLATLGPSFAPAIGRPAASSPPAPKPKQKPAP